MVPTTSSTIYPTMQTGEYSAAGDRRVFILWSCDRQHPRYWPFGNATALADRRRTELSDGPIGARHCLLSSLDVCTVYAAAVSPARLVANGGQLWCGWLDSGPAQASGPAAGGTLAPHEARTR